MADTSKVILITGCSSGIGKALALAFHQQGCTVIASARNPESLASLKEQGIIVESLDVNNSDDIDAVVNKAVLQHGKIDMLINNAGYALIGPAIELTDDELAKQLATNVIAPMALARKVASGMREQGSGMIVNIGSISGIATTPFSGAYCASKAALHALSDALRMELSPFGIKVVTVLPGAIKSNFGEAASVKAHQVLAPHSWYQSIEDQIINRAKYSQIDATPADVFARGVVKSLLSTKPPSQIRAGNKSFYLPLIKRLLPQSVLDKILIKKFGINLINRG